MTLFVSPRRVTKLAAVLKPATLLRFHKALVDSKYRRLFSSTGAQAKPGPKGPSEELIAAIIEMKLRNPRFGCQRIAQQIAHAFGVAIGTDVVRRVLARHFDSRHPGFSGPSWLTFLTHIKDSLWSVDLFRCESILLRSHWVLVVVDVFTRQIIGFGIGCEYLDRMLFWYSIDLQRKLETFRIYYNSVRVHRALNGTTPANRAGDPAPSAANLAYYSWKRHCRGLFETPVAA